MHCVAEICFTNMDYRKSSIKPHTGGGGGGIISRMFQGGGNREWGLNQLTEIGDHTTFSNKQKMVSILHKKRGSKGEMLRKMTLTVLELKILTSRYE